MIIGIIILGIYISILSYTTLNAWLSYRKGNRFSRQETKIFRAVFLQIGICAIVLLTMIGAFLHQSILGGL